MTEKGVKFLALGQLFSLLFGVIGLLAGYLLIASLGTLFPGAGGLPVNPETLRAGVSAVCCLATGLCFITFATYVLMGLGVVLMYQGRGEFGEEHASKVKFGTVLIVTGFILSFIPFLSIFSHLVMTLGLVFMIVTIVSGSDAKLLHGGIICAALSCGIVFIQYLSMSSSSSPTPVCGALVWAELLRFAGVVLLLMSYSGTYQGLKKGPVVPASGTSDQVKGVSFRKAGPFQKDEAARSYKDQLAAIDSLSQILALSTDHAIALYHAGFREAADLKGTTVEELAQVEEITPTAARKIISVLESGRKDEVIAGFSRRFGIKVETARAVYEAGYMSIDELRMATTVELIQIDELSPTDARRVVTLSQRE